MSLLALPILYPYGNLTAIDAYFFGASASTESGLNTVDVKDLKTYQQLYIYFIPIITNLGFINIVVVIVRLYWFKRHLKRLAPQLLSARRHGAPDADAEDSPDNLDKAPEENKPSIAVASGSEAADHSPAPGLDGDRNVVRPTRIKFDPSTEMPKDNSTLYIPGPQDRERGHPIVARSGNEGGETDDEENAGFEIDRPIDLIDSINRFDFDFDRSIQPVNRYHIDRVGSLIDRYRIDQAPNRSIRNPTRSISYRPTLQSIDLIVDQNHFKPVPSSSSNQACHSMRRRRRLSSDGLQITAARSMERVAGVAASMLVLGAQPPHPSRRSSISAASQQQPALNNQPFLSRQATIGRNSQFHNLTSHDRELLGGIEYRSLKLLLKVVTAYFFGIHLFGAICLVGWIQTANPKYEGYLQSTGQDKNWW
ncbi:hypothetical protein EDB81DRAFT_892830 [Dactylonectria macrodidyma]|uniref:Uncharacterized protein n=1 Tax=Dactylonectria macrodidyma TaxID=307937 RepID=A0A9P9D8Y7_9HYPO|nr:hypothetical protein EDB81DRAFT_892830 [Dactylonectria macrodidyma]